MKSSGLERPSGGLHDVMVGSLMPEESGKFPAAALENFTEVFKLDPGDRLLLLLDNQIDHRVPDYIWDYARRRGCEVAAVTFQQNDSPDPSMRAVTASVPDVVKPMVEWATFVVSTWFSSTMHPYYKALRKDKGQRWVKITYFRNLDLLRSEAASFPINLISTILRKTASRVPRDVDIDLRLADPRGTDLRIQMTKDLVEQTLGNSRWRGELTADRSGCYVHYLPTHGPNIFSGAAAGKHFAEAQGIYVPQWGVGFARPFSMPPQIEVENAHVSAVHGDSPEARTLREMLIGGNLEELGCGFNPKWPRDQLYPAGSNAPGALHIGFNLVEESDHIREVLPDWPEPPIHVDLVTLDGTVTANGIPLVTKGRLAVLDDEDVRAEAAHYGHVSQLLDEPVVLDDSLGLTGY
jgi:hypothetical protein